MAGMAAARTPTIQSKIHEVLCLLQGPQGGRDTTWRWFKILSGLFYGQTIPPTCLEPGLGATTLGKPG